MNDNFIEIQNPWWQEAKNITHDPHLMAIEGKPYRFTPPFLENLVLAPGDIFILRGPRQVGKTTALKLLIQRILAQGDDPQTIFYLSCEGIESFRELQNELIKFLKPAKNRRVYLFLDEISFVPSWQRAILAVANMGLTAQASLLLTGSNARDLKTSSERLPGRRGQGKDLQIYPLSIKELKSLDCFKNLSQQELLDLYLLIGGFPRAIAEYVSIGTVTDSTYEIYRNWILGDAARYQLRQETLRQILYRVAETLTSRITWPKLIENSPVRSHETALEYVEHLQDAFLCRIHYCYNPDTKGPATQKARKLYFVDPLLYGIALSWREGTSNVFQWIKSKLLDPSYKGKIFESSVINMAARANPRTYYWYSAKENKEVDLIILPEMPGQDPKLYEIKLSSGENFRCLNQEVQVVTKENFMELI